jgi:hypothetical protein
MERGRQMMTPVGLVHLSTTLDESALPESTGPTGKQSASKDTCSVWKGERLQSPTYPYPVLKSGAGIVRNAKRFGLGLKPFPQLALIENTCENRSQATKFLRTMPCKR